MNNQTYIIAEAGVNHNGSLEMAKKLIDVAAESGVDAVKFQTFQAEKLVSKIAPKAEYQTKTTDEEETQFQMLKKLELDEESHYSLIEHCHKRNIAFLSTPFDEDSVDFLVNKCHLQKIKVSSGDLTNAPLLLKMAKTKKPIIISSGMCMLGEIEEALGVLAFGYLGMENPSLESFQKAYSSFEGQKCLSEMVTLLHCTTEYPTPYTDVNLRVLDTLKQAFNVPIGFSDHTPGINIPIAAVARGAILIEKHFTLDKTLPGPDHKASLEPHELTAMVEAIRQIEKALGSPVKKPANSELKNIAIARKSLIATKAISKGDLFTKENVSVKRPGIGKNPINYWDIIGKSASRDYSVEEPIV